MKENENRVQQEELFRRPPISTGSLGSSLFECITIDAADKEKMENRAELPVCVQAGAICLCLRGEGKIVINETVYHISQGDLMTILPNTIISVSSSSTDFVGYAIAASTRFMMNIQMSDVVKNYVYISANPILSIDQSEMNSIIEIGEALKRWRDRENHPFVKEIQQNLLTILCYEIHACYKMRIGAHGEHEVGNSRQSTICQDFLVLVERHAVEHRDMGFYADKLCITTKYLSVVVKRLTGRSPVDWIDRTVMLYARTLLSSSDMTVQQIAAELNFPNPSFFGQYFKRHDGCTPRQYRLQKRG